MKDKQYKDDRGPDWEGTPMFSTTHARTSDPQTSKDAAIRAETLVNKHGGMIMGVLKANEDGMNFEEIAIALQSEHNDFANTSKVSRRMVDLERKGLAVRTGTTRATTSGRMAEIWRAV